MRPEPKRIITVFAFLLLATTSSTAKASDFTEAEEDTEYEIDFLRVRETRQELYVCILLPYRQCQITLDLGMGLGGGSQTGDPLRPDEKSSYLQMFFDGSALFRVSRSPSLQIGPLFGLDLEIFDESQRVHLYLGVRNRLWAGRWVSVDLSAGAVGSFDERWNHRGFGGIGEFCFSIHGHAGIFVQAQVLSGPEGVETRVTGGFRGSLFAWALVLAGMG